jgi:hypothetical protein
VSGSRAGLIDPRCPLAANDPGRLADRQQLRGTGSSEELLSEPPGLGRRPILGVFPLYWATFSDETEPPLFWYERENQAMKWRRGRHKVCGFEVSLPRRANTDQTVRFGRAENLLPNHIERPPARLLRQLYPESSANRTMVAGGPCGQRAALSTGQVGRARGPSAEPPSCVP